MKKITLLLICMFAQSFVAQNTFDIAWMIGVNGAPASPTIEMGDSVRWTWGDALSHSVTSDAGSQESFDSGILTGLGTEFSNTFTQVGTNPYHCDVHSSSMFGTVTVVGNLSVEDKFVKNLNFYPNPVKNELTIASIFNIDSYQIYNVLGTLVSEGNGTGLVTQVAMGRLNSGLYFVKVISRNLQTTLKIAKK